MEPLVSLKNGQILSWDAVKVLKDGVIDSDKWNLTIVFFLFVLQKGFPFIHRYLIHYRLHCVGFEALITQLRF